jgi:hypothetical protein
LLPFHAHVLVLEGGGTWTLQAASGYHWAQ